MIKLNPKPILILLFYFLVSFQIELFSISIGEKAKKNEADVVENVLSLFIPSLNSQLNSTPLAVQLGKFVPLSKNLEQMNKFFNSLKETSNKKIRIAHYGDSQIQGDIISENLREKFQDKFGGKGVGYLAINSNDIKMRKTTDHSFSDDWEFASIITRNPYNLPFGVSGAVAIPKIGSWVKYRAMSYLKSSSSFDVVKVYYSHADPTSKIEIKFNNGKTEYFNLQDGDDVQILTLKSSGSNSSFELKFISGKAPNFYGVSLESGNGIYLDNFPMPGNTGASLLEIPTNILNDFNKLENYSLLILSYGNNVSSPNRGIFTVYENKMLNVIDHLRKSFPNASILMLSVNDKTVKRGSQFVTNPDVPILIETQKKIVDKAKVTYWNLWEAMGGLNSMNEWVNAAPPMALKDFAHFTPDGGERVAQLLFDAILSAYTKK